MRRTIRIPFFIAANFAAYNAQMIRIRIHKHLRYPKGPVT